jgi:sodium transport system permease protein
MIRDRRTLISMIVVPIVAMPLLFMVIGKFMGAIEERAEREGATIAVQGADRLPGLRNALAESEHAPGAPAEPGLNVVEKPDLKAAVLNKEIAAGLEVVDTPGGTKQINLYYDRSRQASEVASDRIRAKLNAFKEQSARIELIKRNVPPQVLIPFQLERVDLAPQKKMAGMVWGGMLAYVVVLLMFSGGMYPAIDLAAGEKERRTLEVLLSSPAGRDEIILGKILATTTAVFATALLTVASMMFSFRYMKFGKSSEEFEKVIGSLPVDPGTIALVLAALLPTAIMAASIMIAIALLAKSFKEAQSYLTPLVMAVIFPLVIGMLPGITLTPALSLVPLFNVCQLIKEIFQGEFSRVAFGVTMLANVAYAAIAFAAAVQVFKNERVLFRT